MFSKHIISDDSYHDIHKIALSYNKNKTSFIKEMVNKLYPEYEIKNIEYDTIIKTNNSDVDIIIYSEDIDDVIFL
jgi:hypothetical protein